MFQKKFGEFSGSDFPVHYLGYHCDSGWAIYGKSQSSEFDEPFVEEICAVRESDEGDIQWVAGRFDTEIAASSERAYSDFLEAFPMPPLLPFF